jgi:hypothetical protein
MKKKSTKLSEEDTKTEFETFRKLGQWEISNFIQNEPTCFNGMVSIKKYKFTVELIEEPPEVYRERLQQLWNKCDNHHHWHPLQEAALEFGLELKIDEVGRNR